MSTFRTIIVRTKPIHDIDSTIEKYYTPNGFQKEKIDERKKSKIFLSNIILLLLLMSKVKLSLRRL